MIYLFTNEIFLDSVCEQLTFQLCFKLGQENYYNELRKYIYLTKKL